MIVTPHWELRSYMGELRVDDANKRARRDARLAVMLCFILHANHRLRCYPSTETLCRETGFNRPSVIEAREWLIARKALVVVPHDKRIGDERKLPNRQFVYQLTGVIEVKSGLRPYLLMTPETTAAVEEELRALAVHVSLQETSEANEGSRRETLKQVKGSNGKTSNAVKVSYVERSDVKSSTYEPKGITSIEGITNSKGIPAVQAAHETKAPAQSAAAGSTIQDNSSEVQETADQTTSKVPPKVSPVPDGALEGKYPNAYTSFHENIGALTGIIADDITDLIEVERVPESWIVDAIAEAARQNVRRWKYAYAIVQRWKRDGRDGETGASQAAVQVPVGDYYKLLPGATHDGISEKVAQKVKEREERLNAQRNSQR